jgi:hypothetical protein
MGDTAKAPVDVFAKVRDHDRLEQLEAAREHDLLPYFRLLTSRRSCSDPTTTWA